MVHLIISLELLPSLFILFFIQSLVTHKVLVNIFTSLWQVTVSFIMSLCPFIHMGQLVSHWKDFLGIWYWKSIKKMQVSLKSEKNDGVIYMKTNMHLWSYLTELLVEWDVSDKSCKEIRNTFYVRKLFFFFESLSVNEMMWKNTVQPDMPLMKMLGGKATNAFSF